MEWSALLALGGALLANSFANFFVKKAGMAGQGLDLYLNPWFATALILFGCNLLAYAYAVKTIPLSVAYPVLVGGSVAIVSLLAYFFFGERFSWSLIGGMALILAGVYLVVR